MATKGGTEILARVDEFRTSKCRLSFARSLFVPRQVSEDKPDLKYGATFIFPKDGIAELKAVIGKLITEAWPKDGVERFKSGQIKNPILKGDGKEARNADTGEIKLGLGPDVVFIRPNCGVDRKPWVRWRSATVQETEDNVYSGCWGKATLNAYAYRHPKSGPGISFGLVGFQKQEEGERFGAAPADPSKHFESLKDAGDAPGSMKEGAGAAALFDDF
jgi:Protein of unknown function (DUF2815)